MAPGGSPTPRLAPLSRIPTPRRATLTRFTRDYRRLPLAPTLPLAVSLHFADCHAARQKLLSLFLSLSRTIRRRVVPSLFLSRRLKLNTNASLFSFSLSLSRTVSAVADPSLCFSSANACA